MKNRFRYRGATALLLGLSMIVPVGSAFAAEKAEWKPISVKKRSYFVPDSSIEKNASVLKSSERLLSTKTETGQGRLINTAFELIGQPTHKDVADASQDKVTIIPGPGEVIGNDWYEYETVRREKAYKRTFSQTEKTIEYYAEQTRTARTYEVTDLVRTVETWVDPATKKEQQQVSDKNVTRSEVRYSAWTETGKQVRVEAGNRTKTWGPETFFATPVDEPRVKRTSLMPGNGMADGWWLKDSETFRYFVAGDAPPIGARLATDAKGNEITKSSGNALGGANSDWSLVNSETIRYFLAGSTPPAGAVAADPDQRKALLDPATNGWFLANSELVRFFVPGNVPPQDAKEATPEQRAAIEAGVPNDWHLVDVQTFRNFIAGNVPPSDATLSPGTGQDPLADGSWATQHVQSFRFFVPIPGDFENDMPDMPANPPSVTRPGKIKENRAGAKVVEQPEDIRMVRQGLLIKRFYPRFNVVPRTQEMITTHGSHVLKTFTTYESREIPITSGGKTEMVKFQVPVKNYRWELVTHETTEDAPYEPLWEKLADGTLPDLRASEVSALAAATADRPGSFQGDSGSGGKANLAASQLREKLSANAAKSSQIVLTPEQIAEEAKRVEEENRKKLEEEIQQNAAKEAERQKERDEQLRVEKEKQDRDNALVALSKAVDNLTEKAKTIATDLKAQYDSLAADIAKLQDENARKILEKVLKEAGTEITEQYQGTVKVINDNHEEVKKEPLGHAVFRKDSHDKLDGVEKAAKDRLNDIKSQIAAAKKAWDDEQAKLNAPVLTTYQVDAKKNAVNYFTTVPSNIGGKVVGKLDLVAGKTYEIAATGKIDKGDKSWVDPTADWLNNASKTRLQVIILRNDNKHVALNYKNGLKIKASDYPAGSQLGFVIADGASATDLNDNAGAFTVNVTAK